jgi:hydroxymethylpyrimidine pyrophosphatase-like HAD family hydrolase/serine/threonine-protein kinase RIO1
MDKNTYLDLLNSFETQKEKGFVRDQYFLELESHYIMVLTTNANQKLAARLVPKGFTDNIVPLETLYTKEHKLELVKIEDAFNEWKRINFPGTDVHIFQDYTESELIDSLQKRNPVSVCGDSYNVIDLLGCGKESRVFKAVNPKTNDTVALKAGIVSLEKEAEYLEEIKRKLKDCKAKDLFPDYFAFDKDKNIIVMEYVAGKTLESYIAQGLKSGEPSLDELLLLYADSVINVCELKDTHGILYGQFNLQNIIMGQKDSMRFIDPLYSLPPEKYDALQIIRVGAILMEAFYGLKDKDLPEKTKSAVSLEELRNVGISDNLWAKLGESQLSTKPLVDYKIKEVIKKCLKPESRLKNLSELKEEFEEIKNLVSASRGLLCQTQKGQKESAALATFESYMTKRYGALALDFNNTLSHTEETDKNLLKKISQLLEDKIPVAIISGRRTVGVDHFMNEIRPFIKRNDALNHLYFYSSGGAIGYNVGTKQICYEILFDSRAMELVKKEIKKKFPQINFDAQLRTDGYRLNFHSMVDVNELNKFFAKCDMPVIATTSGTSIDISPDKVSKGVALADFASRLGMSIDDIAKIADQGQKGGNDNSLLSGFGAFSVDKHEPNSNQVSTVEALGLKKVLATAWLLDNLKFNKGA